MKIFGIEIVLSGKDKGASALLDKVAMKAKMLRKEESASGERALEKMIGQGPEGLARALGVGLPVFAIDMAGKALGKVGEKMEEVRRNFVMGKEDARAMWASVMEGVPVFGEVFSAGENIREAFTGEKLAIELINQEAEITKKLFDDQTESANNLRSTLRDIANDITHSKAKMGENLASPEDRPKIARAESIRQREAADDKAVEEKKKKQAEDDRKVIQDKQNMLANSVQNFRNQWGGDPGDQDASGGSKSGRYIRSDDEKKRVLMGIKEIQTLEKGLGDARKKAGDNQNKIDEAGAADKRQHALEEASSEMRDDRELTEKKMEARRELEEKGADDLIADRKRWAEEALEVERKMIERRNDQEAAADEVLRDRKKEAEDAIDNQISGLESQKMRSSGFHATLVNSRFHGVADAQQSLQAAANARLDKIIDELRQTRAMIRDGRGGREGIALGL